MSSKIFREYKFKFYLNANHYIIINGKEGETHPHTWEFMVDILMKDEKFIQFDAYEKAIDEYFNQYQNRIINQIPPFDETSLPWKICRITLCTTFVELWKNWEDSWLRWKAARLLPEVMSLVLSGMTSIWTALPAVPKNKWEKW